MRPPSRSRIAVVAAALGVLLMIAACTSSGSGDDPTVHEPASSTASQQPTQVTSPPPTAGQPAPTRPAGTFTMAFAGDVHFMDQVGDRLARDPATVFAQAAPALRRADFTMVNLETAVTTGGDQQAKEFTFRAPPVAFAALRDAGVDLATMANNHGADYGLSGLRDTFRAMHRYHFPVVGIGPDADAAFAPFTTTLSGVKVAILAADQVQDETTLPLFSARRGKPGVANAYDSRLVHEVRAAKRAGYVVVVYLHWGIEYDTCASSDQTSLASTLAQAGASAVVGTHAHVLQGDGWLPDGAYVAYGLGNYLWWRTFGNDQDDNGVLTLTFDHAHVVRARFAPAHLDQRGVPVPAAGAEKSRIDAELRHDRGCTDLSAHRPTS